MRKGMRFDQGCRLIAGAFSAVEGGPPVVELRGRANQLAVPNRIVLRNSSGDGVAPPPSSTGAVDSGGFNLDARVTRAGRRALWARGPGSCRERQDFLDEARKD